MRLVGLVGFAVLLLSSCNAGKNAMPSSDSRAYLELKTTPCFGRCATYVMRIGMDGQATFKGEQYTDKKGDYKKTFSEAEVKDLFDKLVALNPMERPDVYDNPRVTDLPSNILTFFDGKVEKTIKCRFDIPDDMLAYLKELRTIAESREGWEAVTAK